MCGGWTVSCDCSRFSAILSDDLMMGVFCSSLRRGARAYGNPLLPRDPHPYRHVDARQRVVLQSGTINVARGLPARDFLEWKTWAGSPCHGPHLMKKTLRAALLLTASIALAPFT